jgi:hypothetical protein
MVTNNGDYTRFATIHNNPVPDVVKQYFEKRPDVVEQYLRNRPSNPHEPSVYERGELTLYTAFGHIPETVEDGFLIDQEFSENAPMLTLNVKLPVRLADMNNSKFNENQAYYVATNKMMGDTIIFGRMVSLKDINFVHRKLLIVKSQIGSGDNISFHYTISIKLENKPNTTFKIESSLNKKARRIEVQYSYDVRLGIGTKVCNKFGQKGEIAGIVDMSKYRMWTKYGRCVKPQLMMSAISPLSRNCAGQTLSMLTSEECAYGVNGEVCAPQKFVISQIHDSTKLMHSTTRVDNLKTVNGFDGNELPMAHFHLKQQHRGGGIMTPPQSMSHFRELLMYHGINITFKNNQ